MSDRHPDQDPDEARTEVRATEVRRSEPPLAEPVPGDETAEARVVHEDERVRVNPDGSVDRRLDRVEDAHRRRRPVEHLGPWLLALLLLVLAGIAAAWYFTREETKPVPGVTSLQLNDAVARLQDDGFKADIRNGPSDEDPGVVYDQDPAAGVELEEGGTVQLLVSEGPETVPVPNAVGLSETEARDRLAEAGFAVNVVEVFSDEPEGRVVAQNPAAGENLSPDETVRLNVSKGPGTAVVPDLVGLQRDDAEAQLADLGLEANVVEVPSDQLPGTVVAQNPTSGEVDVGTSVRLNVATGG